ncbi:hypothetical protein KLEP7_gp74 [Pseudaeromonas phage vB_PpeM_ KLEP7]|nr:hypothetical protein KLEP7_gp74 [Pseudaeromonas phage vB_PpeM_ KLEP7]
MFILLIFICKQIKLNQKAKKLAKHL